jgi:hypothetical protein
LESPRPVTAMEIHRTIPGYGQENVDSFRRMFERDKEELLASYEILARESLEDLSPEDRNGLYRRLNLAVRVPREGEPKLSADIDLTFSKKATSC